jgi:hypothetical protein
MKMKVTYEAANGRQCTVTLHNAEWREVRGVRVLKGEQWIRGKMVNRSIAATEIVPNGIRTRLPNPVIR